MKTLNEAKDSVAKKHGYKDWADLSDKNNYADDYEIHFNEASELYAKNTAMRFEEWKQKNGYYWYAIYGGGYKTRSMSFSDKPLTLAELFNEWDKLGRP